LAVPRIVSDRRARGRVIRMVLTEHPIAPFTSGVHGFGALGSMVDNRARRCLVKSLVTAALVVVMLIQGRSTYLLA
jgi:hypothetical protein